MVRTFKEHFRKLALMINCQIPTDEFIMQMYKNYSHYPESYWKETCDNIAKETHFKFPSQSVFHHHLTSISSREKALSNAKKAQEIPKEELATKAEILQFAREIDNLIESKRIPGEEKNEREIWKNEVKNKKKRREWYRANGYVCCVGMIRNGQQILQDNGKNICGPRLKSECELKNYIYQEY